MNIQSILNAQNGYNLHCLANATYNETNSCYNPHPDLVQQPKECLLDMINDLREAAKKLLH